MADTSEVAAASNPVDHSWYNAQSLNYCNGSYCTYGASKQYALQEIPGEWFMFQQTQGTVERPNACYGAVYDEFPGESGDSGPEGYSPSSDTASAGATYTVGFSGYGFSYSENVTRTASVFGPVAPHGWGLPAFGSRWDGYDFAGCTNSNEGLGSEDDIHLGPGQSPYDLLVVVAGT